eukprot:Transcript_3797.p1 GENE.Transcript_3797~~Transcript_3797.p1  ORF type:complete len:780 (-),score=452.24 Transcript_3797:188-2527(-)
MAEGQPARRARNLLSSYYGASVSASKDNEVDDMDIDGSSFNCDKYVSSLLQYKSLPELMQRGIAMVSEIKSLDSDMQMLVYENYNKFISATDTIRKMKNRVEEMETQMGQLEGTMETISSASDSVNSSLSERRSQLEGLNGVKRNLAKLQFLMDLPARLQGCVDAQQYDEAVEHHRRAQRILRAVGHVASFQGIREEAAAIMRRLTETLRTELAEPTLAPAALGRTTRLLLLLDGNEDELLKEYLSRRRRALHEQLSGFSPAAASGPDAALAAAAGEEGGAETVADVLADEAAQEQLGPAASFIAQLGRGFIPLLVQLHDDWQKMVGGGGADEGKEGLGEEEKQRMVLEALQELAGGYIEMCRRQLQEEEAEPTHLLQGLEQLLATLKPLHELVPQARLQQKASRLAEQLAKRAVDAQMQQLTQALAALAEQLTGDAGAPEALAGALQAAGAAVSARVKEALAVTTPLLAPVAELLGLRADGLAKHLVGRLQSAVLELASACLRPCADAACALLRAGLCSQLAAEGVAHLQATLKLQLAPDGLSGAALAFEVAPTQRRMQQAADQAVQVFVEMQAQAFSLEIAAARRATDWLACPPPREVDPFVEQLLGRLRAMQSLAAQVFPGEAVRPLLPQGPFPVSSPALQLVDQRSRQQGSHAIQKDMQRMFARKISLEVTLAMGDKAILSRMLTHVVKLTLKTLVEEVRLGTYGRAGFQQLQVDCGMLRWVLPACVDDEGAVLALLDEAIISCQDRCVEIAAVEHSVLEGLCERKRQQLLLALA